MGEVAILERAIAASGLPPLPERRPCVRHRQAGSGYVVRCYACESGHEPKLRAWAAALPHPFPDQPQE